jgi:hypothetical protein
VTFSAYAICFPRALQVEGDPQARRRPARGCAGPSSEADSYSRGARLSSEVDSYSRGASLEGGSCACLMGRGRRWVASGRALWMRIGFFPHPKPTTIGTAFWMH